MSKKIRTYKQSNKPLTIITELISILIIFNKLKFNFALNNYKIRLKIELRITIILFIVINFQLLVKFFLSLFLFIIYLLNPSAGLAFDKSDPSVSLLQKRISNNFSKKYCKPIQNGFSKDEAMKSAIVKTQNIISFSYNTQKKWIEKDDLANQISLQVVNDCGWSFGLIGKEGVDYFKSYFLEVYEKSTPDKNFSR